MAELRRNDPTPLSPQVFQILLSVADGPRHGYAIIQDVRNRTGGAIRLTASTLYDALARLVDQEYVQEVEAPAGEAGRDSRRRYYQLTRTGRAAAQREARRLQSVVEMARSKRLLSKE